MFLKLKLQKKKTDKIPPKPLQVTAPSDESDQAQKK